MKILLTSVFVDDQEKALNFYTHVLGFIKEKDMPLGRFKWLTVRSPEQQGGVELLLEPNDNPVAKTYQKGLREQGIPCAMFFVDNLADDVKRIKQHDVRFTMEPTEMGPNLLAVLDDTCGNLIQLIQVPATQ